MGNKIESNGKCETRNDKVRKTAVNIFHKNHPSVNDAIKFELRLITLELEECCELFAQIF